MIRGRRLHALLPMKAHSERVPNKNRRALDGRPLYHHILDTLDSLDEIDRIVIDTDSDDIASEASLLSTKVVIEVRPEHLRGDAVSMNRIIAHDIAVHPADLFVQTHATNPCLRARTIAAALAQLLDSVEHDSLFSVSAHKARFYEASGRPLNHDPENLIPTQDLPTLFEENSCLYVFSAQSFAARERRIGLRPKLFPTPIRQTR